MNYYEHHIGDYSQASSHLTFVEDAAYRRLLQKYYATEKPLPRDLKVLQRLVMANKKEEKNAVVRILNEFFTLTDVGWKQARCEKEIARYKDRQNKARRSAELRWEASSVLQKQLKTDQNLVCERIAHHTPDTRHQIPNTILHTPDKHQNNGWKNKKISLKAYPCRLKKNEKNLPRITYATSEKPVFYDRLEKHPQCYAKQVRPSGLEKVMLIDPLRPNPGLLVNQESAHRRSLQGRSRPDTSRAHPLAFGQYSFAATPALDAIVSRFRQAFVSRWRAYLTMPKMRCAEHW